MYLPPPPELNFGGNRGRHAAFPNKLSLCTITVVDYVDISTVTRSPAGLKEGQAVAYLGSWKLIERSGTERSRRCSSPLTG